MLPLAHGNCNPLAKQHLLQLPIEKKNQSHFLVTEISNIPFMLSIDNMKQGGRIAHSYIDYFGHIPS